MIACWLLSSPAHKRAHTRIINGCLRCQDTVTEIEVGIISHPGCIQTHAHAHIRSTREEGGGGQGKENEL